MHKDAFDLWWEWAEKPLDSAADDLGRDPTNAVMALPPDERRDRAKVNQGRARWCQTWTVASCRIEFC